MPGVAGLVQTRPTFLKAGKGVCVGVLVCMLSSGCRTLLWLHVELYRDEVDILWSVFLDNLCGLLTGADHCVMLIYQHQQTSSKGPSCDAYGTFVRLCDHACVENSSRMCP